MKQRLRWKIKLNFLEKSAENLFSIFIYTPQVFWNSFLQTYKYRPQKEEANALLFYSRMDILFNIVEKQNDFSFSFCTDKSNNNMVSPTLAL